MLLSGVLALTVAAALPTRAVAVSIWNDVTPGTESVETFQYKDYADRYSDAYELYGYDAEALFNHYETVGKAEGRVARFKKPAEPKTYEWASDEPLDPLPPLDNSKRPDWFDARTFPDKMSNARLVKEHQRLEEFMEEHDLYMESTMVREEELLKEIAARIRNYENRRGDAAYLQAISQDIDLLRAYMGD